MKNELISIFNDNIESKLLFCASINDRDDREFVFKNIYKIQMMIEQEKKSREIKTMYIEDLYSIDKEKIECSLSQKEIITEFAYLPGKVNKILNLNEKELSEFKKKEKEKIKRKINEFLSFNKIEKENFFNSYFESKQFEEENKTIKKDKLKEIMEYLPLKYFIIKESPTNEFTIKTLFPLVDYIIEEMFITNLSNFIIKINQLPEGLKGYVFEYSVINAIESKYDKIIRKKIKNIYKLNSDKDNYLDFNTKNLYSIKQTNFRGNYYDFALFYGEFKKLILFQISLHKEWKDIISRGIIQNNCEEIMKNINAQNNIISENDILFYYVIPKIDKNNNSTNNKKIQNFINDLNKFNFTFLEFNLNKNDFDKYIIDFNDSNAKIFNKISAIGEHLILLEKIKSLEINNIRIDSNILFLGRKHKKENFIEKSKNEILKFFNDDKNIYDEFLNYCKLDKGEMLSIYKEKSDFNDFYLYKPFFLVMKEKDKFVLIHKVENKIKLEIFSGKEGKEEENENKYEFEYICDYKNFCLLQIIDKNYFIDSIQYSNKKKNY